MASEAVFQRIHYDPGELILEEGKKGSAAFLIVEGEVEILVGLDSDKPTTLAVLGPGQVFGEMGLFDDHPNMASVVATHPTDVSALHRKEFQRLLEEMDPVIRGIMYQVVERARQMANQLHELKEGK